MSIRNDPLAGKRSEFEQRGFARLPGLFGPLEMARIARWVGELETLPETPGRAMKYFDPAPSGRDRILNRIENFVPFHPALAELAQGEALRGTVAQLLGEPAVLFKDKINCKQAGAAGFEPHQDSQAGWEDYASLFVTAAVAIDAATVENGCLELARWPHRRELIGALWKPLTGEELRDVSFEPVPMAPGDAVFFDSYLPHRSAPNHSRAPRRLLYLTYNRAAEGDHRARYYADKRRSYPPDCEREPDKHYEYRV
jgi:hypothetical protein